MVHDCHQSGRREVDTISRNTEPGFKLNLLTFREQERGLSRMALFKMDFREADLILEVQI